MEPARRSRQTSSSPSDQLRANRPASPSTTPASRTRRQRPSKLQFERASSVTAAVVKAARSVHRSAAAAESHGRDGPVSPVFIPTAARWVPRKTRTRSAPQQASRPIPCSSRSRASRSSSAGRPQRVQASRGVSKKPTLTRPRVGAAGERSRVRRRIHACMRTAMAVASRPTPAAKGHVALALATEVVSGSHEGPLAWLTEANSGRHVYPSSSGLLRRSGQIALLPNLADPDAGPAGGDGSTARSVVEQLVVFAHGGQERVVETLGAHARELLDGIFPRGRREELLGHGEKRIRARHDHPPCVGAIVGVQEGEAALEGEEEHVRPSPADLLGEEEQVPGVRPDEPDRGDVQPVQRAERGGEGGLHHGRAELGRRAGSWSVEGLVFVAKGGDGLARERGPRPGARAA